MKYSLRPAAPDDLAAISQLLQKAFNCGPDAPFLNPRVMAWKYWDRRDDWDGPRSYVLERDGSVAAHVGVFPLTFDPSDPGGTKVTGIQMIDWAASPDFPGAGIALLQRLTTMFDFIYSIGGSDMTRDLLPRFGFVEHTRQWSGARSLRPFHQILHHQHKNWKLAPRLVRNWLWSRPRPSVPRGWTSHEAPPGEPLITPAACFSPRASGFFEYLSRCPVARIRLYRVELDGKPQGHFALSLVRGQARLAGVWLRDPDSESWKAVFALAQQAAARLAGVNEIVAAGSEGASSDAAVATGFRIVGQIPVYLLNKKGKVSLPPDFQFQLADDDAAFRDEGAPAYWT